MNETREEEALPTGAAYAATLTEAEIRGLEGRELDAAVAQATGEYRWYTFRWGGAHAPVRQMLSEREAETFKPYAKPTRDLSEAVPEEDKWDRSLSAYSSIPDDFFWLLTECEREEWEVRFSNGNVWLYEGISDSDFCCFTGKTCGEGTDMRVNLCRAYLLARRAQGIAEKEKRG